MYFLLGMGFLTALGLILAKYKAGGLEQIKNAQNAEHQIPMFVALHEPPTHH